MGRKGIQLFVCGYAFPSFLERVMLVLIPAFILPHFYTGIIYEVRQMVPPGFVVIPAAFFWMFRESN